MDSEKIIQELNQRFAAPLPEFYKRRIIFWYDEDKEFENQMTDISLANAKIVALTGTNNFAVKKLLAVDDVTSNYLVYCPLSYESSEDDWLTDVELYSEEFRSDLISIWIEEMGIPSTPALRKQVKYYRKFFNAIIRRESIKKLNKTPEVPAQLHMAIMCALAGLKDMNPSVIIKTVLEKGLDSSCNSLYQDFVNYGADEAFWNMVRQGTGYYEDAPDLARLATHMLLTATTRTMSLECLAGLDGFISSPHQAYCYDFVSDWLHGEDIETLNEIVLYVEGEVKLPQRFMKLNVENLIDTEIFPCIHEVILIKTMMEISHEIINIEMIKRIVEKRRTCVWYEDVKEFYEGILQIAHMQSFYKEHAAGFHHANAKELWKKYTEEYYKMDTYYRYFHKSYTDSMKSYNANLHDLFGQVQEKAEGLYATWFLAQLGANWSNVCDEELANHGRILEVPQQTDFYDSKVRKADSRIFVIISDALRYEVAASLTEQLRRETQSKVELNSMQGVFPTITKYGMAALLPNKHLSTEQQGDILKVLADGQYTDSNYRDKVLKSANPNSIALSYKDIVDAKKRAEQKEQIKGKEVVYIYHDTIDETSHNDEMKVFGACDEAIIEIKNLVRIIVNAFGGTNIILTSDHGFLYTYSPLTEDDKLDKSGFINRIVEYGRRYAIMSEGAEPEYLQKIKFLAGDGYEAYAPRENIRIKKHGGGLNFVHGGFSLQEMCVPLVEYHFLRNQSKEYLRNKNKYDTKPVEIGLLSATHKVSNMIFSLNFYQKEAVCDNREAATYQVFFADASGKQISDVQTIIADKTSDEGQERIFRCNFSLKSQNYDSKEVYYLIISDSDAVVIAREEFQIDIAFADDFGF